VKAIKHPRKLEVLQRQMLRRMRRSYYGERKKQRGWTRVPGCTLLYMPRWEVRAMFRWLKEGDR